MNNVRRVLSLVASNLETFTLFVGPSYPDALHSIELPALRELTIQSAFLLPESLLHSGNPKVETLPSRLCRHVYGIPWAGSSADASAHDGSYRLAPTRAKRIVYGSRTIGRKDGGVGPVLPPTRHFSSSKQRNARA